MFFHTTVLHPMLAQVLPALSGGAPDWLVEFSTNLTNMTTQNADALTNIGMTELSFIAMMMLVGMVIQWNTSTMSLGYHRQPIREGDLVQFLVRLVLCMIFETFWVNPIPGVGIGLNKFFSLMAQTIVTALDQNALSNLQHLLKTAADGTSTPSMLEPAKVLCYYIVQVLLGLTTGILFLINISGFILYAVTALFGPVFIPLYMTNSFRGKFFHFIDVLLSFAMIRAVAAAFIFVWGGFMNAFILQTFNNDYSMEKWSANLVPCVTIMVAFILNLLFIPTLTQTIFGGAASLVAKAPNAAGKLMGS